MPTNFNARTAILVTIAALITAACSQSKASSNPAPQTPPDNPVARSTPNAGTTQTSAPQAALPPVTIASRLPALDNPTGTNVDGGMRWQGMSVAGTPTCTDANIYPVFVGSQAVFGFRNLGLNLPAWTGTEGTFSCSINATVTLPKGYYVKTISQIFTTKLVKELSGFGGISSRGYFLQDLYPLNSLSITFDPTQSIPASDTDFVRSSTQTLAQESMYAQCAKTVLSSSDMSFKFSIDAALTRPLPYTNFTMSYGDNDFQFSVNSEIAPCPVTSLEGIVNLLPR